MNDWVVAYGKAIMKFRWLLVLASVASSSVSLPQGRSQIY